MSTNILAILLVIALPLVIAYKMAQKQKQKRLAGPSLKEKVLLCRPYESKTEHALRIGRMQELWSHRHPEADFYSLKTWQKHEEEMLQLFEQHGLINIAELRREVEWEAKQKEEE